MGLDFDLHSFIEDMRACKPPYKCPLKHCGKVFKTFSGIHRHITSHDGEPGFGGNGISGMSTPLPSSPVPFFKSPIKESLVYNDAMKRLEFEAEGRCHILSVYENLELVSKEDWEATLPKEKLDDKSNVAEAEANAVTPAAEQPAAAGPGATPKSGFGRFKKKRFGKTPNKPSSKPSSDAEAVKEDAAADNKPKLLKLPEAHFTLIEDYDLDDAPPMTKAYYRFIEKPLEEQDEEVEYDMDEEDVAWLDLINERRTRDGLPEVEEAQFELLMDRLEKESYFHVQTNGKDYSAPVDDDAICCVCMDGECSNTNVILFCDLCNLAVHQECYGVPYIPEGQWLCRRCLQSPSRSVECCLCPNKGGAFKRTDDGRWAHVVCGLWIPEVRFANTVFLEPIDSIDNIPPARWKLSCRVCKQRGVGACIQCHKTNCYTAMHVTCGLLAGLHMKMDTIREPSASGLSVTVRKTAFCDVHTPLDSDCKPKLENVEALGISTPKQKGNSKKQQLQDASPVPVLFRGLMNFSPQCPWEKVQEIAGLISVPKRNQFFQRLMAYWTLKRQTRNGVPLIRRLQFAKAMRPDKAPETPQKNAHHSKKKKDSVEKAAVRKAKDDFKAMLDQRKMLRRLRQDLERVRLLCELIRKREQRKRELVANKAEVVAIKCWPFAVFLKNVLENLQTVDVQDIFSEPVSLEDVPDYLEHVKKPMDFKTMSKKLENFEYLSLESMEADFTQMVDNCLSYNERDTIFFRLGVKMRDQGGSLIRQARRQAEVIGFDAKTLLHSAHRGKSGVEDISDDKLMKEIDAFIDSEEREEMGHEEHLKRLLELNDKAALIHHPVAKVKRQKLLKQEITKTRRKLSMDKAGTTPKRMALAAASAAQGAEGAEQSGPTPKVQKGKKNKNREVSPVEESLEDDGGVADNPTPGRRLRAAGKEDKASTPAAATGGPAANKGKGRKRQRAPSSESEGGKKAKGDDTPALKTPVKASSAGASSSPAKSPAGVNRRNAVLFTRKKQNAAAKETDESGGGAEEGGSTSGTTGKQSTKSGGKAASGSGAATESDKRKSKDATSMDVELELQETEVQSPAPLEPQQQPKSPAVPTKGKKKRGRKPKNAATVVASEEDEAEDGEKKKGSEKGSLMAAKESSTAPTSAVTAWRQPSSSSSFQQRQTPSSSSFQQYRRAGDMGETDDDEGQSGSATDAAIGTSSEDDEGDTAGDSDDDSDEGGGSSMNHNTNIPLEPLDLVWAKCRGYPWYPALIINPKMPRTGYLHNGVPVPVPPPEVLDMAQTHTSPHCLILFFDAKRTWRWLQRDKLEPLGVDPETDKGKLVQSKKPAEKKAVKKAYEEAILHRFRVTGENASISGERASSDEDDDDDDDEKSAEDDE